MIEIPYGVHGYLVAPLVKHSSGDFQDGPTLAAGDAKLWTDEGGAMANITSYYAPFAAGRTKPEPGDEIFNAGASSETATVVAVVHSSGAFASTDAAGALYATSLSTTFSSGTIGITGGTSAACEISTAFSSGLMAEIDGGHVSVPHTATEMKCRRGFFLLEDATTTKEWEDQSIPFITIGHPLAGNPYKAIPSPSAMLSTVSDASNMGVESSGAPPTTSAWNGGTLVVVEDGLTAFGHVGQQIVASSSGGDLDLDPGFQAAPNTSMGAYILQTAPGAASSGSNLPNVNAAQINKNSVDGSGASSDPWDS